MSCWKLELTAWMMLKSSGPAAGIFQLQDDDQRDVVGLTSVDGQRLFVLRSPNKQQIEIYDTTSFKLKQTLNVAGLSDHFNNDLTACVSNRCLYVSDVIQSGIFKVPLSANSEILTWKVDSGPTGISVNDSRNLLVTCRDARTINEYLPNGSLVREIRLQLTDRRLLPWHAIQLAADGFIVCLNTQLKLLQSLSVPPKHDVIEMNSQGQVVTSYKNLVQSATIRRLKFLRHLAVDTSKQCIFVTDRDNNRIVMLNRSNNGASELNTPVKGPRCIHLHESTNCLYVGERVPDYQHDVGGRIFVFDVSRQWNCFWWINWSLLSSNSTLLSDGHPVVVINTTLHLCTLFRKHLALIIGINT